MLRRWRPSFRAGELALAQVSERARHSAAGRILFRSGARSLAAAGMASLVERGLDTIRDEGEGYLVQMAILPQPVKPG